MGGEQEAEGLGGGGASEAPESECGATGGTGDGNKAFRGKVITAPASWRQEVARRVPCAGSVPVWPWQIPFGFQPRLCAKPYAYSHPLASCQLTSVLWLMQQTEQ